ncbi:MAG: ribonuclease E/G [Lachnospiraceae bacterium]|jgi:ribonuclease G|nr:ribonuclease E/G [Lachnospiraceae bacterium]
MKQKVIITKICWLHQEYLATALYQDWKLMEINLEAIDKQSILGNIYVGRVKNIVKNLNAAFIEIAPGLPCYYPMDNIQSPLYVKKANSLNLVQGDEVVVQVIRESTGKKPPKVSTNLNLTGKYLVLTSENTTLGISRKLSQEVRENLKKNLIFEENSDFGIIVRTNASNASTEEILVEYEQLKQEYFSIKDAAPHRTVFSCLKRNVPEYLHYLQNLNQEQLEGILTDDRELLEQIQKYLSQFPENVSSKLSFYEDSLLSLNKLYSLDTKLKEALQERVWLKSGGYLIIQPTEALTVIDVNSGKSTSKKQVQEHYLKINLQAAEEIAHQLRLRNLSGIIIVDFIDMKSQEDNQTLLKTLRACVRMDSVPVQVVDMTKLHLVELTRKKVKKSLAEQLQIS